MTREITEENLACPTPFPPRFGETRKGRWKHHVIQNSRPHSPQDTGGLQSLIKIAVGCRVMLRINIDVSDGLVNGACGWIDSIETSEHREVKRIYVKFDGDAGQRWCTANGTATVGINPHTVRFFGKDGRIVRRQQFPLVLAWAKTIHKSQGATEHGGVRTSLDRKVRMPGQAYVALSRAPSSKLVSLDTFTADCIHVMKGIQWSLNELYIQQAKAKPSSSHSLMDRRIEELFRPPLSVEHYEGLRRTLPRPSWKDYHAEARGWKDDEDDPMESKIKCPRCGEELASEKALRTHNKTCKAKTVRKRPANASSLLKPTKLPCRPTAAATQQPSLPPSSSRPTPRWKCGDIECGQAAAEVPEWFNPTACDAVNVPTRQQKGATCGYLAALHVLVGAGVQSDVLRTEDFRTIGGAGEHEQDNFSFFIIHTFLNFHGVGLETILPEEVDSADNESTVAFLVRFPFGTISKHWVSILRREPGEWLVCDSLRSTPFEARVILLRHTNATHLNTHKPPKGEQTTRKPRNFSISPPSIWPLMLLQSYAPRSTVSS